MQKQQRTSREAQYNARVQAAYESIRYMGHDYRNDLHELFSVASQSAEGLRYQVTHDLVSGRMHCTCLHGQNGKSGCIHEVAVTRLLSERAAQVNAAADAAVARHESHESHASQSSYPGDVALMRRDNRTFAERWMR